MRQRSYSKTCPIEMLWGTVCESVWSDGVAKTLVNVRPSVNGEVTIKGDAPSLVSVDLGPNSLFAMLARAEGCPGRIDESIKLSSNLEGSNETEIRIVMEPRHKHYLHNAKLENLPIFIQKGTLRHIQTLEFRYSWRGQELGVIRLLIDLKVTEETKEQEGKSNAKKNEE